MNNLILKLARRINISLQRKICKAQQRKYTKTPRTFGYNSLSPIKDANVYPYIEALKWALDNSEEKEIFNIALTGPYGSGKSSILKTFIEKNRNDKYVFLNISLATFKEEPQQTFELSQRDNRQTATDVGITSEIDTKTDENADKQKKVKGHEEILRLIELSILQQIFYHEEDKKIPDSRFKKIKTFNRLSLYYITGFLLTSLVFGINLFYPKQIEELLRVNIGETVEVILHWISITMFATTSAVLIFQSVRILYGIRISKFKFQQAEIEIDKNISKSILNNHLDEILYFFEVTPYSVVLIEDLDRFRQSEIFTKLRELNQLINNSKRIKNKKVVFIYAVRDEMFQNKERTKFFDFIIPVIPVINSSNSKEKLADININQEHGISPEIIEDISLFIDDMRLLFNITNEFNVYSSLLDKGLPRDKLFAMLVYKNIYPEDFVALGNNNGILYDLLQKRTEFIKENVTKINSHLELNKKHLHELKLTMLKETDELRRLYVAKFVDKTNGFSHFSFGGNSHNIWEAATEDGFEFFKTGNFKYYIHHNNNGWYALSVANAKFDFMSFQAEVDDGETYDERIDKIKEVISGMTERLKHENELQEKRKADVRHVKLKDIFSEKNNYLSLNTKTPQGRLLGLLLRSGYIAEDYLDYISLFYEGSLTKLDQAFFINVKSQIETDHDTPLVKLANLIKKIRPADFRERYLLNYNLVDFMLVNDGYDEQLHNLLSQLHDGNHYGAAFIDGFMISGVNTSNFINELMQRWPGLWKFVDEDSDFTHERKEEYFSSLIINADVSDLRVACLSSKLGRKIAAREDFLTFIPDVRKLENIIINLEIIFTDVILADAPKSLVELVIKGTHYALSDRMLRRVMQTRSEFDLPTYETGNYAAVLRSGIPELVTNINNKLDHYVSNIYLILVGNIIEPEEELLELLNSDDIRLENRKKIVARSETVITNLEQVAYTELDETIFRFKKLVVNWNNVIHYFSRHKLIDQVLVDYLNDTRMAEELSWNKIIVNGPIIDLDTTKNFMGHLVCEGRLTNVNFELLTSSVTYDYDIAEISGINKEQMRTLVDRSQIAPTPANFDDLKSSYPGLQHNFLNVFVPDVMKNFQDYAFEDNDIGYIMKSSKFKIQNKLTVIQLLEESVIARYGGALAEIQNLMLLHHPLPISKNIMIAVLNQYTALDTRIKLFNMYYQAFNGSDAQAIFGNFPAPFNKIGVRHTSFVIGDETELQFFANNLKEINMIVNYKQDKKGIKIINFKWN